ncbi:MAG: pyridoxamine kinase, partial [Candidatus Methanomethylophilaceae archaeon]|nr:pyridoxamine kinase [Candidatus Methanomethylophilaceae archaeon]
MKKQVLAIHDVSCVGRCSLTVALPIISAAGIECSVLPTAVLSTHTGGFTGFTYRDLTEDIQPIKEHWKSLGLEFSAVYTGFLGSEEQVDLVIDLVDTVAPNGKVYVDPVMGDKGSLYPVFGPGFPKTMRRLCERADLIMPNMTELTGMLGLEFQERPYTREYVRSILEKSSVLAPRIVITGVGFSEGEVGAVYFDHVTGEYGEVLRPEIPGYYHGTGDVFGSALVGAIESGVPLGKAVEMAVDLTVSSISLTHSSGADVRYGVDFEPGLYAYAADIRSKRGPHIVRAVSDDDLRIISSMASTTWKDAYDDIIGR